MRIVVVTDVHANLPALTVALDSIRAEGYDLIVHTGDAIAIGPYPAECLDLLLSTPNTCFVMGNHDAYFVNGLPTPLPTWMSEGEVRHQHWTHAQLDPLLRPVIAEWPHSMEVDLEGVKTLFMHYALDQSGQEFQPIVREPGAADLDKMFALHRADLIFYGHDHRKSNLAGQARYVNPGALGCHSHAIARYCVAEFLPGQYRVEERSVPYDDTELFTAFERRAVPEREFLYRAFFGGRFHTEM